MKLIGQQECVLSVAAIKVTRNGRMINRLQSLTSSICYKRMNELLLRTWQSVIDSIKLLILFL